MVHSTQSKALFGVWSAGAKWISYPNGLEPTRSTAATCPRSPAKKLSGTGDPPREESNDLPPQAKNCDDGPRRT